MRSTKIEWTEHTWNPFVGCSVHTAGCTNCYAMKTAVRLESFGQRAYEGTTRRGAWSGRLNRSSDATMNKPLAVNRPAVFFVNSMSDFWHEAADDAWRVEALDIMERTPGHTYQVLTKRPENISPTLERIGRRLPPNIWLGATVEDSRVKHRIRTLTAVSASIRFLSIEPLIGPVGPLDLRGVDWVITGGESGPKRRSCEADWVRSVRDDCAAQNVAFFHKQWGHYDDNPLVRAGQTIANAKLLDPHGKGGALIDGVLWRQFPEQPILRTSAPNAPELRHTCVG